MSEFDFGERFEPAPRRLVEVPAQRKRLAERAVPFNVSFLDDIALGILPTDFIVLGAKTGAGKTTLGNLFAQNSARRGWRCYYFALEAHRLEIEQRMLYREMAQMLWADRVENRPDGWGQFSYATYVHGRCEKVCDAYEQRAIERLSEDTQTLHTFYREKRFTAKDIQRLFHAIQHDADLIVFDHLHFVESDLENENRALKEIVVAVSDAVDSIQVPVIAIAHLRKEDLKNPRLVPHLAEFHGSSELTKHVTKAIVMGPARDQESPAPWAAMTYMKVAKDRIVGELPFVALTCFDLRQNAYASEYALGYLSMKGDQWSSIQHREERPAWAKGDKRPLKPKPTEVPS